MSRGRQGGALRGRQQLFKKKGLLMKQLFGSIVRMSILSLSLVFPLFDGTLVAERQHKSEHKHKSKTKNGGSALSMLLSSNLPTHLVFYFPTLNSR